MKQKWFLGILSFAILLSGYAYTAFAANPELTIIDGTLDFRNDRADCSGDGWEWNADTKTLRLEDFHATVPRGKLEEEAAIFLPKESTVTLIGKENEIHTMSYYCNAFQGEGELTIGGKGKLKITIDSLGGSAFYVQNGPIFFEDKTEITIEGDGHAIYVDEAKGKTGVICVSDQAKVIFPKKGQDRNVIITRKPSVHATNDWFDYAEEIDPNEDTVTLVKKAEKPTPAEDKNEPKEEKPEEIPREPMKELHEYQITIGNPNILKDGKVAYTGDVPAYISNGYTMLPLRALLEVSDPDVQINWEKTSKTAIVTYGGNTFAIIAGSAVRLQNGNSVAMLVPAELKDGRMFVSLRDWTNLLHHSADDAAQLSWDSATKTVTLRH